MEKEILELLKGMAESINELKAGQEKTNTRLDKIENRLDKVDIRLDTLEKGQKEITSRLDTVETDVKEIKEKIDSVYNQTADLTEFKTEVNAKLDTLHDNISNVEIVTATNWADIARLKKVK